MKHGSAHALQAIEELALVEFGVTEIRDGDSNQNCQEKSHFVFPSNREGPPRMAAAVPTQTYLVGIRSSIGLQHKRERRGWILLPNGEIFGRDREPPKEVIVSAGLVDFADLRPRYLADQHRGSIRTR
jgi:hypothetical protein